METLAVVESLKKFRAYLIGIEFLVVTDCSALKATSKKKELISRIASSRWLQLQEYNFTVEYRPGTRMKHVDALSRNLASMEQSSTENFIFHVTQADWVLMAQLTDEKLQQIRETLSKPATDDHSK